VTQPRISDVVHTGQMVGEKLLVKNLLDVDMLVTSVAFRPGQGGRDFAIIQAERLPDPVTGEAGAEFWFVCGGQNVVDALKKAEQSLPLVCKIGRTTSAKGRPVYTIF